MEAPPQALELIKYVVSKIGAALRQGDLAEFGLQGQEQALVDRELVSRSVYLGLNEQYRAFLMLAYDRTGIDPAILAAMINIEAYPLPAVGAAAQAQRYARADSLFWKNHPGETPHALTKADPKEWAAEWKTIHETYTHEWNPTSENPGTHALGLAQFMAATWVGQGEKSGTYLNEYAKANGYLGNDGKILKDKKADFLALRTDAKLSIVAMAEFGKSHLEALAKADLPATTPEQEARYLYIAHHDGVRSPEDEAGRAVELISRHLPEEEAAEKLSKNLDGQPYQAYVNGHGGTAEAAYYHRVYTELAGSMNPSAFRT